MKKFVFTIIISFFSIYSFAQGLTNFDVELEEITIQGVPALQSFAWAKTTDGKWLLIAGRTDGLHDHRPPFSFPSNLANDDIWVVDPVANQVWSAPMNSLSANLKNALSATNTEFQQLGDVLYLVGGYGVNVSTNQHETFDHITAVDVTSLANAIITNQPIAGHFRQLTDARFQVTGGYMHLIGSDFYLVGGQNFDGRYNPHNGPSFNQTYSESIKKFNIVDNGTSIQVANYEDTVDAVNLHRRDYNMCPQIFPNGDTGLTVFSGVFQHMVDLPFFNTVDITGSGYNVRQNFDQLLNQYHTANMPLYDAQNNSMHTVFFGGIGMYFQDPLGVLAVDSAVPFVKTISKISRFANDSMVEYALPQSMPAYLGSGAEFIPSDSIQLYTDGIIDLNASNGKVLAGYVVGGIESTQPNIFMQATGSSNATNRIFKVYLTESVIGVNEAVKEPFFFNVYPNPTPDFLHIDIDGDDAEIELLDGIGQSLLLKRVESGSAILDLSTYASGVFFVRLSMGQYSRIVTVIKE